MSDVPILKNAFHIPKTADEEPYLIGTKCRLCGYVCFPKKVVCLRCRRDDTMEEVRLGPYATLDTFAVMQVGPPDFPPPYITGYVRTKEGVLVFTLISGCEARDDALEMGQEMELVIEKIREDGEGNNMIGWKFKPRGGDR